VLKRVTRQRSRLSIYYRRQIARESSIDMCSFCEARSGGISKLRASRKANAMIRAQKKLVRTKNVVYTATHMPELLSDKEQKLLCLANASLHRLFKPREA
jgi:hypothetical protein